MYDALSSRQHGTMPGNAWKCLEMHGGMALGISIGVIEQCKSLRSRSWTIWTTCNQAIHYCAALFQYARLISAHIALPKVARPTKEHPQDDTTEGTTARVQSRIGGSRTTPSKRIPNPRRYIRLNQAEGRDVSTLVIEQIRASTLLTFIHCAQQLPRCGVLHLWRDLMFFRPKLQLLYIS
jgi:hypothetical protein